MNKKLFSTVVAVALIGAIGVGSTFAYLSDKTTEVTNTFTIGNVAFEDSLSAGLVEHKIDPQKDTETNINEYILLDNDDDAILEYDGNNFNDPDKQNDNDTNWVNYTTQMDYKFLYPGQKLAKDPTVLLDDMSLTAYVFVKATGYDDTFKVGDKEYPMYDEIKWNVGNGENQWKWYDESKGILWKVMDPDDNCSVFTSVVISKNAEEDTKLTDIVLKAYAVQYAGIADEKEAFAAVESEFGAIK